MSASTEPARRSWGRPIGIVLRAAHLGAMAVLVGAIEFAAPQPELHAWRAATAATGAALLLVEASHSRHWVYQGRGVVTLLHVASIGLLLVPALTGRAAVAAALGLGAIGSHLPRTIRKWSFRHRRVVD